MLCLIACSHFVILKPLSTLARSSFESLRYGRYLLLWGFTRPSERHGFDEFCRSSVTFIGRYLRRQAAFLECRLPGDPLPFRWRQKTAKSASRPRCHESPLGASSAEFGANRWWRSSRRQGTQPNGVLRSALQTISGKNNHSPAELGWHRLPKKPRLALALALPKNPAQDHVAALPLQRR